MSKTLFKTTGKQIADDQLIVLGATRGQVLVQHLEQREEKTEFRQQMIPCWILMMADVADAGSYYLWPLLAEGQNLHACASRLIHTQQWRLPMGDDTIRFAAPVSYHKFRRAFGPVSCAENRLDVKRRLLATAESLGIPTELIPACSNMAEFLGMPKNDEHIGGGSPNYKIAVTEQGKLLLLRKEDGDMCWRLNVSDGSGALRWAHAVLWNIDSMDYVMVDRYAGLTDSNEAFAVSDWRASVILTISYTLEYDDESEGYVDFVPVVCPDFEGWRTKSYENSSGFLYCELGPLCVIHQRARELVVPDSAWVKRVLGK